jgi:hypothetical protein
MDITQIVAELKAEVARIENAIASLVGLGSQPARRGRPPKSQVSQSATGRRTMSPAARKRIGAAKKAWWAAQQKGASAPKKAMSPTKQANARKPMSPAARKKLSALAKARWAKAKKSGAKSL